MLAKQNFQKSENLKVSNVECQKVIRSRLGMHRSEVQKTSRVNVDVTFGELTDPRGNIYRIEWEILQSRHVQKSYARP